MQTKIVSIFLRKWLINGTVTTVSIKFYLKTAISEYKYLCFKTPENVTPCLDLHCKVMGC